MVLQYSSLLQVRGYFPSGIVFAYKPQYKYELKNPHKSKNRRAGKDQHYRVLRYPQKYYGAPQCHFTLLTFLLPHLAILPRFISHPNTTGYSA